MTINEPDCKKPTFHQADNTYEMVYICLKRSMEVI